MRVALLGGTADARELAERITALPGLSVETSLAGRVGGAGAGLAGSVRIGGFGGFEPLTAYLRDFDVVVDATHPFAAEITRQAVVAAAIDVPLVVLRRPGWLAAPGDDWRRVPSVEAAAAALRSLPVETIFLTIGRAGVGAFADDPRRFVIRSIEPLAGPRPVDHTVVLARGPFMVEDERELLTRFGVDVLVSKDSGGASVAAKLVAARELARPVIMIDRPPVPDGVRVVASVPAALAWIVSQAAAIT